MGAITEDNPEILGAMLALQSAMRDAASSGGKGLVHLVPIPFSDRHFWDWEKPVVRPRMSLNKLTSKT